VEWDSGEETKTNSDPAGKKKRGGTPIRGRDWSKKIEGIELHPLSGSGEDRLKKRGF